MAQEGIKRFHSEMHVWEFEEFGTYLLACLRFVEDVIDSAQFDQEYREAEIKSH